MHIMHNVSMQTWSYCNLYIYIHTQHILLPNSRYTRMLTLACSSSLSCCSDPGLYLILSKLTTRLLDIPVVYRAVWERQQSSTWPEYFIKAFRTTWKQRSDNYRSDIIGTRRKKKRPGINSFFTTGLDYSGTLIRKYFGWIFQEN